MADNTDFSLNRDSYATFDALTLKQLIKQRLNDGGVFTDQIFEGSNISSIIDIIAYSYHTLLFYLNNTSSESLFSEATLYENMNRIVKLIDYKPTGFQTSLLSFEATANENVIPDLYTIKRYSYFTVNGIYYSFNSDVSFNKNLTSNQKLEDLSDSSLLYQGQYFEYPSQTSIGEPFETITLLVKDNITNEPIFIDNSSIDVYVRNVNTRKYEQFNETNNLFLLGPSDLAFEKRINENGFYELKFGSGVFGKKLNQGDQILIYYLKSDGESGVISPDQLNGNTLNFFTTPQFENISNDIYGNNFTFLSPQDTQNITFSNDSSSTTPKDKEDVDDIRVNSKKLFQSQNRLVTIADYETFINKNFSNIVEKVSVVDNKTYINTFIQYFYDLGLTKPNDDPRFLLNQIKFSVSNESNNVFIFLVPAIKNINNNNSLNFLSTSQKNSIINSIELQKMVNVEVIPQDPVYNAFNLGLSLPDEKLTPEIIDETFLVVKRIVSTRVSIESIKNNVNNTFKNYFNSLNLGDLVSLSDLKEQLLQIEGVFSVSTRRVNRNIVLNTQNLSLISFNAAYPENDIEIINSDTKLPFFKYPFLYNNNIIDNIIVEDA